VLEGLRRAAEADWVVTIPDGGHALGTSDESLPPSGWSRLTALAPKLLERLEAANRTYFWFVPEHRFPVSARRALVVRTQTNRVILAGWGELPGNPQLLPAFLMAAADELAEA
jgi:hypothetical protein